jgi:hypothetical protein
MSHLKWATLTSSQDEIQANLIASTLHEKNIPAVTYNKKDTMYAMLGAVYVLVPEENFEDAKQLLIDEDIVSPDAFEDIE